MGGWPRSDLDGFVAFGDEADPRLTNGKGFDGEPPAARLPSPVYFPVFPVFPGRVFINRAA
jgi:hypothetical protein